MKRKRKGFTLIEVIVALGTFMIVMLAITTLLITTINFTGTNRKTFNTNIISKAVFEAMKESRIAMPKDSSVPPVPYPEKLTGGLNEINYRASFDNEDEAREFVIKKLLDETTTRPNTVSNPKDFSVVKDATKRYSMGIKMKWTDLDPGTGQKGVYEIETWCWDTNKGESTLVNRKTFLAPK